MRELKSKGVPLESLTALAVDGTSGIFGSTIRLTPPMCISKDDADFIVDCLDDALSQIALRSAS